MAAAWTRALGGYGIGVYSAGSEPASEVNPVAVAAMAEVGIDMSHHRPQRWTDEMIGDVDVVVTMGCGDTCPVIPGTRYVDWELTDPHGQGIETVRPIRDEIEQRVRGLLEELGVSPEPGAKDEIDPDAAKALSLKVWGYKQGELVAAMIHLGDRLGLYKALAGAGSASSVELAEATGLDERWLREWLLNQAAAGLIERSAAGVYSMRPEQRAVLIDEDSLLFAAAAFQGGVRPADFDRIEQSMRSGIGFTYGELGIEEARQLNRTNGPWLRRFLPEQIVPLLPGVAAKLGAGGRVLDVGCGGGVAIEGLADVFPDAHFVGIDSSEPAITVARERLAGRANVEFALADGAALPDGETFDLVMTLECLHDMARPDLTMSAIRQVMGPDSTWLIKEMKCGPTFEANSRNPMLALMYGYSVTGCLASATATPEGLGLGTLGLDPDTLEAMVRRAGFTQFERLRADDPVHYYYRVAI